MRDSDGQSRTVTASIVIGADGRHSKVAESVGARKYRMSENSSAAVYGYFHNLRDEGFRWYYRPGVSVGVIPTNEGASCVFALLSAGRFHTQSRAGAKAVFESTVSEISRDLAIEVANSTLEGQFRGFPGEVGYLRQSFGPGWALVGDAGYFKDPITAHGITDALRDAELLTRAICRGEDALAYYQQERDALSTDFFRATDKIASFRWDLDELKEHHQTLSVAMKKEAATLSALSQPTRIAA
jgi:2-polyprenyl-6-methoxyphenol hydroxylase-like FAD-dependent oxidoreductase